MTPEDERRPARNAAHPPLNTPKHIRLPRQRPALLIRLELEGYGRVQVQSETAEDERRLLLWLRRSDTLPMLTSWLEGFGDWLEEEAA